LASIWHLDGIWYTFPATDVLTALVILLLLIPQIRDLQKRRDTEKFNVKVPATAGMEPEQSPAQP
jgi:hypothetical protein